MNDDRGASFRANMRRAIAAFEAVGFCAQTRSWQTSPLPVRTNPERDLERLAGMLCGMRHPTDQFSGLRFHDVLSTANELYDWARSIRPAAAAEPTTASHAINIYERSLRAPTRRRGRAFWPPDTLADLNSYAASRGIRPEPAAARLTAGLITSLRLYADQEGVLFSGAIADGLRAYARQRLSAEGPFETGPDPAHPRATTLTPAASPPFEPVATNQGVVTSFGDAEWLLIRTTARIRDWGHREFGTADHRDLDDRRALADALAGTYDRPAGEILGQLAPQIAARVTETERGPAAATELGREHGHTGMQPYCDLSSDGDATALLNAFGETEWMTTSAITRIACRSSSPTPTPTRRRADRACPALTPASAAQPATSPAGPSVPAVRNVRPRTRPVRHREGSALALSTAHGGAPDDHNERKGNTREETIR